MRKVRSKESAKGFVRVASKTTSQNARITRSRSKKRNAMSQENVSVMRAKIQSLYPDSIEIESNIWEIPSTVTKRTKRNRQQRRAYLMQESHISGYVHRKYHVHTENLIPVSYGGTYVCSKDSSHRFYILGPCSNKRCRVRGCNGKLRLI